MKAFWDGFEKAAGGKVDAAKEIARAIGVPLATVGAIGAGAGALGGGREKKDGEGRGQRSIGALRGAASGVGAGLGIEGGGLAGGALGGLTAAGILRLLGRKGRGPLSRPRPRIRKDLVGVRRPGKVRRKIRTHYGIGKNTKTIINAATAGSLLGAAGGGVAGGRAGYKAMKKHGPQYKEDKK